MNSRDTKNERMCIKQLNEKEARQKYHYAIFVVNLYTVVKELLLNEKFTAAMYCIGVSMEH